MRLKRLELSGFKSFGKKTTLLFDTPITAIVGPNGSGKSNVAEAFRFVLGEQSLKSLRGKRGEDLIFNGGEGGARGSRASVLLAFDNTDRVFGVDFEEVTFARTVHRDGVNDYELNGSKVRLRDVLELLAKVSLGASGHTIVSQGDADRILLASVNERKTMIEESLGLKVYQWKLAESERKLAKTDENIRQVESLRREIGPHLKFLKKQVEKVERADELRRELKELYREYLGREANYLNHTKQAILVQTEEPKEELKELEQKIKLAEQALAGNKAGEAENNEIVKYENELAQLRREKDDLARTLGRLEGMIEVKSEQTEEGEVTVSLTLVKQTLSEIDIELARLSNTSDWSLVKAAVSQARAGIAGFLNAHQSKTVTTIDLSALKSEEEKLQQALANLDNKEKELLAHLHELKNILDKKKDASQGALRELYELRSKKSELMASLQAASVAGEKLALEEADLKREVEEGMTLVDREIKEFLTMTKHFSSEERGEQEKRRKEIERRKLRLEDLGGEGTEVLSEYKQVSERDEYLAKELTDLAAAKDSLLGVIADLKDKLETEFSTGLKKINDKFAEYFSLMFGGGTARLDLLVPEKRKRKQDTDLLEAPTEDEFDPSVGEEQKPGIDIYVNLPRKKIRGLQMLSGGERALTSIALLFAIASVNPPPFLILDETDAALDEANSRKYGEMISALAQSSQLILITHNRETMSRAGVLYGVTMGGEGVSKLLSVRFEEAASFAK